MLPLSTGITWREVIFPCSCTNTLRLTKTFVERTSCSNPSEKTIRVIAGEMESLCHLERQITEVDLIHISHNLFFAFYEFGDDDTGSDVFAGLFRVKPQVVVCSRVSRTKAWLSRRQCVPHPGKTR